jgi:hypothetical protein
VGWAICPQPQITNHKSQITAMHASGRVRLSTADCQLVSSYLLLQCTEAYFPTCIHVELPYYRAWAKAGYHTGSVVCGLGCRVVTGGGRSGRGGSALLASDRDGTPPVTTTRWVVCARLPRSLSRALRTPPASRTSSSARSPCHSE